MAAEPSSGSASAPVEDVLAKDDDDEALARRLQLAEAGHAEAPVADGLDEAVANDEAIARQLADMFSEELRQAAPAAADPARILADERIARQLWEAECQARGSAQRAWPVNGSSSLVMAEASPVVRSDGAAPNARAQLAQGFLDELDQDVADIGGWFDKRLGEALAATAPAAAPEALLPLTPRPVAPVKNTMAPHREPGRVAGRAQYVKSVRLWGLHCGGDDVESFTPCRLVPDPLHVARLLSRSTARSPEPLPS